MSLVVFGDVSLHLGGKPIIEGLSMRVGERDRIGLIGPNGSGKTTLLRLIAGEQTPDGGTIALQRGMRLGYLPQDVQVEGGLPLLRFVKESIPGRAELDEQLERANGDLAALDGRTDDEAMELMMEAAGRIADLHERIGEFDTLYSEHHAKRIMAGLGFSESDYGRDMSEFSGGWKMRAVLSSLLFQQPDLLLLDEPTNHLDMPSVAWFSDFLLSYKQAFILISHDREFLNEQITTVVSYEPEGVRTYTGDYNAYERQRAEERVLLENRVRNQERERAEMEQFVRRFRAKATKAAQVQSRVKRLEKMEVIDLHQDRKVMRFHFKPTERVGKVALEVDSLAKHYGDTKVLSDVNLHVKRGERIALLGVNGAGKTTLLRTLAGELEATSGSYEFGHNTKVSYYAQHHAETLRKDSNVYDEVKYCAKDATHQQIRAVLGAMLFGEREIEKRIGVLSGGERARVALSQMMIDPGNVLLMDEPTNHLDLESSERLAEALGTFDGTLLFVSHNKAFIRALANVIWLVQDGTVVRYPGTFDDYLASCRLRDETAVAVDTSDAALSNTSGQSRNASNKNNKNKKGNGGQNANDGAQASEPKTQSSGGDKKRRHRDAEARKKRRKVLRPLQKRATELEERVGKLEGKLAELNTRLSDPATYEDASKRDPLLTEVTRTQAELDVAMETWSEVQSELDAKTAELDAG